MAAGPDTQHNATTTASSAFLIPAFASQAHGPPKLHVDPWATITTQRSYTAPTFYDIYKSQQVVNRRRLQKSLPFGQVLRAGTPWSWPRQLAELLWEHLLLPFCQGFSWGLAQNWQAYVRRVRPISLFKSKATLAKQG
ncbi:hypothetical protein H4R34_001646 [Dimargaris verticillata]|uniref:Uncharacterized protein n=1 Tax=Dimargaris verticillata TaxID=2761393 RepID=A0A9W8B499_9FUNG|nr:hypothetical protein H4R34_001646 [Dimargaris verticillata]